MTHEYFSQQMDRMKEVWPHGMPAPRVKLFFNACKGLPDFFLEAAVNDWVGNSRHAPVLNDFLEKVREWEAKQRLGNQDRRPNLRAVLDEASEKSSDPEFAKFCVESITRRLTGGINDRQWAEVLDLVDKTARSVVKIRTCSHCDGTGLVLDTNADGFRFVFRCLCAAGVAYERDYFSPLDVEKRYPFRLKLFKPREVA